MLLQGKQACRMLDASLYLPPEVITDILSRVTKTTTLRCKLVCKEWKFLIENPFFTKLRNSRQPKDSCLLVSHYDPQTRKYATSVLSHQYPHEVITHHELPLEYFGDVYNLRIEGSCNGLVFVVMETLKGVPKDREYLIWNHATRKVKHIPKPLGLDPVSNKDIDAIFGFGFYNNDYKLLKVTRSNNISSAKLYSTTANYWRQIEQVPDMGIDMPTSIVIRNEFMHLLTNSRYSHSQWIIIMFDMCNERFRELALPSSFNANSNKGNLSKLGEEIAIIVISSTKMDIWVMNEYCISLTKKITLNLNRLDRSVRQIFELARYRHYPLFLFNDDRFVFHGLQKIYNYKNREITTIDGYAEFPWKDICLYKEA